jgi:hypothetical protein
MIASYPKHRGRGKWKGFVSQTDLARAFQRMLPREPSGDYWIISLSYFQDRDVDAAAPPWDASPAALVKRQQEHYAAGFRALSVETDFNFGRLGLGYYLLSQVLLNTQLTRRGAGCHSRPLAATCLRFGLDCHEGLLRLSFDC